MHDIASETARRLPVGAEVQRGGGVHFRVWAPAAPEVSVVIEGKDHPLAPEAGGYHSALVAEAAAGTLYQFRLGGRLLPDPASRYQHEGVHGPSQVVDHTCYRWRDADWKGVGREGQVLYEMHVGTFTREGTWRAAMAQLPELARLGVTVVEMMPVAEFGGRFGWGYDGVDLYAPTRLYGEPDDLRAFVDAGHEAGIGFILDVVYNHVGANGDYFDYFSPDYFSKKYECEWGRPINFDGPNSAAVREFIIENAGYWVSEFHFDGLRIDATQQIFDDSPEHVIAAIGRRVRDAARGRATFIVNENEPQDIRLVTPRERGGYGLDALWNDDFHHSAVVALTGRHEAYYTDYLGAPQEFISMAKYGYLYQGQRYKWQGKRRGTASLRLHPAHFISFIQNHDQIANTLWSRRIHELTSPGALRAMTALLLLGPQTPMLFQGQEFAASARFHYFADHGEHTHAKIAADRRDFISQFASIGCLGKEHLDQLIAPPHEAATFERCKLDFAERETHAGTYRLHCDLLRLRHSDPVFARARQGCIDGAVLGAQALVLRFFGEENGDRLLLVNLGPDLRLDPAPEPLLAPPEGGTWTLLWSSEAPVYDGLGTPPVESGENWALPGMSAAVMRA